MKHDISEHDISCLEYIITRYICQDSFFTKTIMKSEKVTINVRTMDLAKIDLPVDSLEYSNRSDFCRIAIRQLWEAAVTADHPL